MVRSYWLLSELVLVGVRSLIHIGWQSSDAKCKELGGHDIFGPPPEIPARKLTAAHNLELKANRDMEEPAPLRNLCTSVKVSYANIPEPDLGFNCVGGNAATLVMKFLRQRGTMVTYGGMSKKPVTVSTSAFIFKDLSLRGFWLQNLLSSAKGEECKSMIDYLLGLAREGKLTYEGRPPPMTMIILVTTGMVMRVLNPMETMI